MVKHPPPPKRSPKAFYLVLGAVAVVGVAFLYYQTRSGGGAAQAVTIDPNVPLPKAEGYLLGKPDAPVQVRQQKSSAHTAAANFDAGYGLTWTRLPGNASAPPSS